MLFFFHVYLTYLVIFFEPDFANQDGFSPRHAASSKGDIEIIMELLKVDSKLCHWREEIKRLLHSITIIRVVSEIISVCVECIEDMTLQLEITLRLTVKNSQLEVIRVTVEWSRQMNKDDILITMDDLGNTILHLAIWKKITPSMAMLRSGSKTKL